MLRNQMNDKNRMYQQRDKKGTNDEKKETKQVTLNARQHEAVVSTEGRIRVIAGAGSGKTGVLTRRYLYLVDTLGISQANILCMTFTNKAAQEMRVRIARSAAGSRTSDLICTIHGFCLKVLRRDIYRMGFPKTFTIIDEEDQKVLARQVFEEFGITREKNTLDHFLKEVTAYKAEHKTEYIRRYMLPGRGRASFDDPIHAYLTRQTKLFTLDFNDIIHFAIYLFRTYPAVCEYWQKLLNYVMMDETQDCNENDWFLMETLTAKTHNLFVVGDPDQAIYEWRGAVPKLFIDFTPDKDIVLAENYRSTPDILRVANAVIAHNVNRIPKDLYTRRPSGGPVIHFHGKNEEEEATWVAHKMKALVAHGASPADMAVLYRSSFLSRGIEQALLRAPLPYTLWAGVRFFDRKEIKDVIAYMRLLVADDDLSFLRIINVPSRKIGKAFIAKLQAIAEETGDSLYATLKTHLERPEFGRKPARDFVNLIEEARRKVDELSISDLMEHVLQQSGLKDLVRLDGNEDRLENVAELLDSVKHYEKENAHEELTLASYLQDIALFTDQDTDRDSNTVKLMTVHQSKGLEFPYVFVVGLNEGTFPNARTLCERNKDGEEEERRLMYVAMTRAERGLYLTESEGYNISTKGDKLPSRFLLEVGPGLMEEEGEMDPSLIEETRRLVEGEETSAQGSTAADSPFRPGTVVVHAVFGRGQVIGVQSDGSCTVLFESGAERNLRPDFLRPEIEGEG